MTQRNGKSRETIRTIRRHLQSTREGTVLVVGSEPFAARVREALDPHELERVSFTPREKDPDLVRELEGLHARYVAAAELMRATFPAVVRIEVSPALWRELKRRYGSTVGATFESPHGTMSLAALDSPPENYRVPLRWAADRGIPVVVDHNMPARPDPYRYRVVWSDGRTEEGSALAADGGA